jgi:hypothetical protein
MDRSDFTPVEQSMIAAAERDLGRRFRPGEFELIETPVTAANLREAVEAIKEDNENPLNKKRE